MEQVHRVFAIYKADTAEVRYMEFEILDFRTTRWKRSGDPQSVTVAIFGDRKLGTRASASPHTAHQFALVYFRLARIVQNRNECRCEK